MNAETDKNTSEHTIATSVQLRGLGLHTGQAINMRLLPADSGGIRFQRVDLPSRPLVPVLTQFVTYTNHATTVANGEASVSTIEHLMAAIRAWEIDHLLIEIDGPEVPIMDGSSSAFVFLLERAGSKALTSRRRYMRITQPVRVDCPKGGYIEIEPSSGVGLEIQASIHFDHPAIGKLRYEYQHNRRSFLEQVCAARTFGFSEQVEMLKAQGLIKGASLLNAVVLDASSVLNPEGLRFADEFVRHKVLDCVGDLALLGFPLIGRIRSFKGGHALHHKLCQAVLNSPGCFEIVDHQDAVARESLEKFQTSAAVQN